MGRHSRVAELAGLRRLREAAAGRALTVADIGCGRGRTVRAVLDELDRLDEDDRVAAAQGVAPGAVPGVAPGVAPRAAPAVVHALDHVSALPEELLADSRVRSRILDLDQPLPFDDGALDAVVSLNVVEHLADPVAHLVDVHRVLRPGGVAVLANSDWDTALFTSADDALTRTLVDRFVAGPPSPRATGPRRVDGSTGRKLLAHTALSGARGARWTVEDVTSWADPHRRFDDASLAWKVATGMLAATGDDPVLAARAAGWLDELARIARAGQFLFTVTDVAVVLRAG